MGELFFNRRLFIATITIIGEIINIGIYGIDIFILLFHNIFAIYGCKNNILTITIVNDVQNNVSIAKCGNRIHVGTFELELYRITKYNTDSIKKTISGNQNLDIDNEIIGTKASAPTAIAQLIHRLYIPFVFAIRLSLFIKNHRTLRFLLK